MTTTLEDEYGKVREELARAQQQLEDAQKRVAMLVYNLREKEKVIRMLQPVAAS